MPSNITMLFVLVAPPVGTTIPYRRNVAPAPHGRIKSEAENVLTPPSHLKDDEENRLDEKIFV